jgi:hypothetical protein
VFFAASQSCSVPSTETSTARNCSPGLLGGARTQRSYSFPLASGRLGSARGTSSSVWCSVRTGLRRRDTGGLMRPQVVSGGQAPADNISDPRRFSWRRRSSDPRLTASENYGCAFRAAGAGYDGGVDRERGRRVRWERTLLGCRGDNHRTRRQMERQMPNLWAVVQPRLRGPAPDSCRCRATDVKQTARGGPGRPGPLRHLRRAGDQ